MRVTGNTHHWEFQVWQAGIYDATPDVIDHTIVGMALEGSGPAARLSILMTDCADDLVPPGDDAIPAAAPRRLHRRHGDDARPLHGLARRPRASPTRPTGSCSSHPTTSRPSSRPTTYRVHSRWPTRAGGCSPNVRPGSTTWFAPCTATRRRWPRRCARRPRRSWPATGSSATSATVPTAGPCCSTGPTPARPHRAGT